MASLRQKMVEFYSEEPEKSPWYGRVVTKSAHKRLMGIIQNGAELGATVLGGKGDESQRSMSLVACITLEW